MALKSIYSKYHQKSRTFLYPLLGYKSSSNYKPFGTFIEWYGRIKKTDRKLIVLYKTLDTEGWKSFEHGMIKTHPNYVNCFELEEDYIAYIFTLEKYKNEWNNFLLGKYSKFSPEAKNVIKAFFGVNTGNWETVESYLYPERFFDQYAILLADPQDVPKMIECITAHGELCDPYNSKEECLMVEPREEIRLDSN